MENYCNPISTDFPYLYKKTTRKHNPHLCTSIMHKKHNHQPLIEAISKSLDLLLYSVV